MPNRLASIVACLLVVWASRLFATPREWASSDGKFKVEAELLNFDGKTAKLKKSDGTIIEVPWEKFSEADADFLESRSVEPRTTLRSHKSGVWALAISADGKLLASGGGGPDTSKLITLGELILWNAVTKARIAALPNQGGRVRALAFSPDSKLLAAGYEGGDPGELGRTVLWNMAGRKPLRTIEFAALSLAFSRDGTQLALGGWERNQLPGTPVRAGVGAIMIWDVKENREVARLKDVMAAGVRALLPSQVEAVAFAPDGKSLASCGADGKVRLWDLRTQALVTSIPAASAGAHLTALAFSPDGATLAFAVARQQLIGTALDDITLWNLQTAETRRKITLRRQHVSTLSFSNSGHMLAVGVGWAGNDGGVFLYDPVTGDLTATLRGQDAPVKAVAFTPGDKAVAAASMDNCVRLWDVPPWLVAEKRK